MSHSPDPKDNQPLQSATNGRGACGRFALGNVHSRGHGRPRQVEVLRQRFIDSVSGDDVARAVAELNRLALHAKKECDRLRAIEILFDRVLGRPTPGDELEPEVPRMVFVQLPGQVGERADPAHPSPGNFDE